MASRFGIAFSLLSLLASAASAQTVIVQDNFDQYADTAAFLQQWVPTTGLGTADALPADLQAGILTSDPLSNVANFPGVEGVAVDHIGATATTPGMVNQWGGVIDQTSGKNPAFQISPSTSQTIHLSFDIFMSNGGNERLTVGLRNTVATADGSDADTFPDATTSNILELGAYNGAPNTPTVPGAEAQSASFGFRIINFGPVSDPLTAQPNWQYFKFDPVLDRETDADTIVNVGDIGAGWHTYEAFITPTEIKLTVDLFRDGFKNVRDEAGAIVVGSGVEGVDAELILPVSTLPAGFNNLRIGGPSGASSPGTGAVGFDNILLETLAVAAPTTNADFNGDNIVDGADFLVWQRGFGAAGTLATGDANGDLTVNDADLAVWKTQFGTDPTPATVAVGAVPEPATFALAGMAIVAGLAAVRRR